MELQRRAHASTWTRTLFDAKYDVGYLLLCVFRVDLVAVFEVILFMSFFFHRLLVCLCPCVCVLVCACERVCVYVSCVYERRVCVCACVGV